jgi:hypothetical protein
MLSTTKRREVNLGPIGTVVLPPGVSLGRLLAECEEKTLGLSELSGEEHVCLNLRLRAPNLTPETRERWIVQRAKLYEDEYKTWAKGRDAGGLLLPPGRWDRVLDWLRRKGKEGYGGARLMKASTR